MSPLHIQSLAQVAVSGLLNSLPEGLLIALFAWTTLHLLPRQNARTRFAVWFLALLAIAALPFLGVLIPAGLNQGRILGLSSSGFRWASSELALSLSKGQALARPFAAGTSSAISLPAHWAPYIFFIWLLAALTIMTRLAVGLWRLRQLRRSCVEVEAADLDPTLGGTVAELTSIARPVGRPMTIATSERIRVPAALGLWSPMIVLPTWALRELSPSDLGIILRHEFAHLQRWDDWTNLVQKIVRALFFFHPALWWIEKRLSVEREMACDDVVVAQTENPAGYANCLISLLERSLTERGWTMAQALVHRAREASLRLTHILDGNRPGQTRVSKPALVVVGAFTLLCLVVLPHRTQVVAFKQGSQLLAGNHEYSVALPPPASLGSSLVQSAKTGTSTGAKAFAASLKAPALRPPQAKSNSITTHAALPVSGPNPAAARLVGERRIANNQVVASSPETFVELNVAFADQNSSLAPATLVFFEATEYVESDAGSHSDSGSHYTVWRVQVLRLTVVNSVWKHKAQPPVAHST